MPSGRRPGSGDTYTDQVRETLVTAIADGVLEAGRVYPMQVLAEQLGVSRTPVREALLQLQQRSLIRIERNQGVRILRRTIDDLGDVFQIRQWLEVPAAEAAAANMRDEDDAALSDCFGRMMIAAEAGDVAAFALIDRDFHAVILERSGNDRVVQVVNELREFLITHGHATTWVEGALMEVAGQHEPIMVALAERDGRAAAAAMADHLSRIAKATIAAATADASGDAISA
jgi:DNA-binding GntR family transcriptional regulator